MQQYQLWLQLFFGSFMLMLSSCGEIKSQEAQRLELAARVVPSDPTCGSLQEGELIYNQSEASFKVCVYNSTTQRGSWNATTSQLLLNLECTTGQIPKWNGAAWVCENDNYEADTTLPDTTLNDIITRLSGLSCQHNDPICWDHETQKVYCSVTNQSCPF